MPTFITLVNWTDQGIKSIKESPARLDMFKQAADSMGCTVKDFYLVTGDFDIMVVVEAPDAETAVKMSLATSSKGSGSHQDSPGFLRERVPGDHCQSSLKRPPPSLWLTTLRVRHSSLIMRSAIEAEPRTRLSAS